MIIRDSCFAEQMAHIHMNSLPNSFLGSLGLRFLTLLYVQLIIDDKIITLGEIKEKELLGFITAGEDLKKVYMKLLRKPIPLLYSLLRSEMNFKKIGGIFELIYYILCQNKSRTITYKKKTESELYLLAVNPKFRRNGVASKLFEQLVKIFAEKGKEHFKILVGDELKDAQKFYEKHGAIKRSRFLFHGKFAIEYLKDTTKSIS